jgi:hypothetical protein
MRLARTVALVVLGVLTGGCAEEPPPAAAVPGPSPVAPPPVAAASPPPIAAVHRARCGQCHVRVEPGTRTRDALVTALARHRNRVHLAEEQWAALIDYLAPTSVPSG